MIAVCTVTATMAGGVPLELTSTQLTLDDSWSPYAQAALVARMPADASLLDPRTASPLTLNYRQEFGPTTLVSALSTMWAGALVSALSTAYGSGVFVPGEAYRDPVDRVAVLHVRRRRRRTDGTVEVDLASGEALISDLRHMGGGAYIYPAGTLRELVGYIFEDLADLTPHTFTLAPGSDDYALGENPSLEPGMTYDDFLAPYLQAGNLRLWCDELGLFHLTDTDAEVGGALVLDGGVNVTGSGDVIDRDGDLWADAVIIEYDGADTGLPYISAYPRDGSLVSKTLYMRVESPPPFDQFSPPDDLDAPAKNVYNRLQRRGREIPVEGVADYAATPGTSVTVTGNAGSFAGIVRAVTWTTPDHKMIVTTRDIT